MSDMYDWREPFTAWRPASEAVNGTSYLVKFYDGIARAQKRPKRWVAEVGDSDWARDQDGEHFELFGVTHIMPLPAPPEAE